MKTGRKRFISLLCIVSMLCSLVLSEFSVRANANTIAALKEAGYTYWTLSDVQEADRSIEADNVRNVDTAGNTAEGTLDKTIFTVKMGFPTGRTDGRWHLGGNADGNGFLFRTDGDSTSLRLQHKFDGRTETIADFNATDAGVTSLRGDENLAIALSVEYTNKRTESNVEYVDLKVGVFFNGTLYGNDYYTVTKVPTADMARRISFSCKGAYSMKSNYLWERPQDVTMVTDLQEAGYTYWTLSDVQEADRDITADNTRNTDTAGNTSEGTLNKTIFTAKMGFPTGRTDGRWHIGGVSNGKGFLFRTDGDATSLRLQLKYADQTVSIDDFNATDAGVTSLRGDANLAIALSVEYTNVYTESEVEYADLKVGVFFNGKLYKNSYYTVTKVPTAEMARRIDFGCKGAYSMKSNYLWERPEDVTLVTSLQEAGYTYWTLSDVQEEDRSIAADNATTVDTAGYLAEGSLDKTIFAAKIGFPEGRTNGRWHIGGTADGKGFLFRTDGDATSLRLQLKYADQTVLIDDCTATDAKVDSFRGDSDLAVALSVEYSNVHTEGDIEYADLKVGVFFNGKLYKNAYYELSNIPTNEFGKRVSFYSAGAYTMASNYLWERPVSALQVESLKEAGYTYWTLADVFEEDRSIEADGDTKVDTAGQLMRGNLDKTIFAAKIGFPEGRTNGRWHIGGVSDGRGFLFRTDGDATSLRLQLKHGSETILIDDMTAKDAGVTTFRGDSDLKVALSVEYVNTYTEGDVEYADLKVGVFFNGALYKNAFYDVEKVPTAELARRVSFYSVASYTIASDYLWEREAEQASLQEALLKDEGFEYWTLADMGVDDQTIDGDDETLVYMQGNKIGDSLDKSIFTAKITFPDEGGDFGRFWIGGVKDESGFCLRNYSNKADGMLGLNLHYTDPVTGDKFGVRLTEIYPGVAGTPLRQNEDLIVSLSWEYTDTYKENDIEYADLKVGLYFNGLLYNDNYLYAEKVPTSVLCRKAFFYSTHDHAYASNYLWAKSMSNYRSGLTELKASDFGLGDAQVVNTTKIGIYDDNLFAQTAVTMMMKFPGGQDGNLYFGAADCGIRLRVGNKGSINVSYVNADKAETELGTINPKDAGLTNLTNKNLKWQFVFLMNETWNEEAFVNFGVYVNGKMCGDSYFLLEDVDTDIMKRIIGVHAGSGKFQISDLKYEELSFCDFNILDTRVDKIVLNEKGEGFKHSNYYDFETVNNTAFTGKFYFAEGEDARFAIGDKSFWHGFIVKNKKDGRLRIQHVDANNASKVIVDITPEKAGVDALVGKECKIRMTFDVMQISDERADVKLGIWINDKLYEGQYYVVNDIAMSTLTRYMKLWSTDVPYEIKSVDEPADLAMYGFDVNWRKTLGIR